MKWYFCANAQWPTGKTVTIWFSLVSGLNYQSPPSHLRLGNCDQPAADFHTTCTQAKKYRQKTKHANIFSLLAYYFVSLYQDMLLIDCFKVKFCYFLLLFLLQNVKYLLFWAKSIENFVGAVRIHHHAVHILVNSGRSPPVVIVDKWMLFCWQPMAAKTFRKHSVDRSLSHWTIRSLQASGCNNETRIDKNEGIDLRL